MQAMERVVPVANETDASFVRTTKEKKKITYKLKVLQQPERARACGSGAKSSADRRPVDPPPIVELRIYEGENADKEITFQLSANYFLFATLEQARPIAQGRVAQDPNRLTVLTGTPVAGMVYLDRPSPAGYFIFPDLSVRHEGKYRLSFNLYEELKEGKDDDQADDDESAQAQGVGRAHVTHRLEVKSQPFVVYSAKKFPGLASSTSLSRTVAEQGCRVRIRRDVRMRKRDKTGKGEWDDYEDETAYDRAREAATPDIYGNPSLGGTPHLMDSMNRQRSASIGSHVSLAPAAVSRRTSLEMAQMYQQNGYPPQPMGSQIPQGSYTQSPYGPPAAHQFAPHFPAPPSSMQTSMPPPQPQAQSYTYAQPVPVTSQHAYYGYASVPPPQTAMQQYEGQQHTRNGSMDLSSHRSQDTRRMSVQHSQPSYPYSSTPLPSMASHVLPPLNTTLSREKLLEPSSPTSPSSASQYYDTSKPSTVSGYVPPPGESNHMAGAKRSYGNVFDTRHANEPLRQGARPSASHEIHPEADDSLDDQLDYNAMRARMSYRRADGREVARPLPPSF